MLSGFVFMLFIVCFSGVKDEVSHPEQQELPSEAQDFLCLQEVNGLFRESMVNWTPDLGQWGGSRNLLQEKSITSSSALPVSSQCVVHPFRRTSCCWLYNDF